MKFRNIELTKVENLAGGQAYELSAEFELVALVLTSFVSDSYYRSAEEQLKRLRELVHKIPDKKFIAQVGIYARNESGMRSITHALMGELVDIVKNEPWLKYAIAQAIRRPDDILEIVAYYLLKYKNCGYKKGLPAALRKGIELALTKFDAYQLAKYRGSSSQVKMVDVLNLVHPHPRKKLLENNNPEETTEKHVYSQLINNTLKCTETWESQLSQAGQEVDEVNLKDARAEVWSQLIREKKLGYFALLRNLRNIITHAPESVDAALEQLTNVHAIKQSLVLPFRFLTAYKEIQKLPGEEAQKTLWALNVAIELSLSNVPVFNGSTLIALDISGSMIGRPQEIGSLFTACIAKNNPKADVLVFKDDAEFVTLNKGDSVLTLATLLSNNTAGGTNFRAIFNHDRAYDRIIILSDMQAWVGHYTPEAEFKAYCARTGKQPFIHSFDLAGYGTAQFPAAKIFCYAGFSEKILDVMHVVETEPQALINKIKKIAIQKDINN